MRKKTKLEQVMRIEKPRGRITQIWHNPVAIEQRRDFFEENVDKDIVVTYKVVGDAKSIAQLGFYYGAIRPAICKATGDMDKDRIHYFLKDMFIAQTESILGRDTKIIPSLADISRPDMSEFIENCLQFLSDAGGFIDEQKFDEYESVMLGNVEGQIKVKEEV